MRLVTWNVNGIRARFAEVAALCQRERPDVLCLQEIKATAAQVPEPLTGLPGYVGVWHGGPKGYSGVSLHVRREVCAAPALTSPRFDVQHRVLELALERLCVLSVYVPNGNLDLAGKLGFLEALRDHVGEARARGEAVIVCGDLNVARHEIDVHPRLRRPVTGQLPVERDLFQQILDRGLVDLGRHFAPDDDGLYTWWPPWREEKQKNRGWRLDYVLCSAALAERAIGCRVLRDHGTSDHAPVIAELGAGG